MQLIYCRVAGGSPADGGSRSYVWVGKTIIHLFVPNACGTEDSRSRIGVGLWVGGTGGFWWIRGCQQSIL